MNKQINISEALDWYIWAGVTEICSDTPSLCIEEKKETPILSSSSVYAKPVSDIPTTPAYNESFTSTIKNARDICTNAQSLQELRNILEKFEGCPLRKTAANTVFGDGNHTAKVMFIGEAPGADEDRIGKPFVGRCGRLLDKMLEAIHIERSSCYITNILPWRPPGNRTPTDEEIAVCLPFLKRQIELISPDYILLLGGIALKSVMDTNDSISRARGKWLDYTISDTKKAQVLATYHPSYLLRTPSQKSKVWADFLRLKIKIGTE